MTRDAGFTLLELLLAIALTAIVATASLAALNVFVEADARAIQRTGQTANIARALLLLQNDVRYATGIDVQPTQWTLTQSNGSSVVYAVPVSGTALNRFVTNDLLGTLTAVQALVLAGVTPLQYGIRGHLRDVSYDGTAVIQGALGLRASVFRSALTNRPVGISVAVDYTGPDGPATSSAVAVSLPLAERYAKP